MFDLRDCTDAELLRMKEELTKTRANPVEQMAVVFVLGAKLEIDRALAARRTMNAATPATPEPNKTGAGKPEK